jgi:hypothetical protein
MHSWWECNVQPLWKSLWRYLKKVKIELHVTLLYLLGYISKQMQINKGDSCTTTFIATLFIIVKLLKQPQCPRTHDWIDWYIYTREHYSTTKKNDTVSSAVKWLEPDMLSDNPSSERQISMFLLMCRI